MYYSIYFGNLDSNGVFSAVANTWDDWHLIPASRPTIVTPQAKLNLIKIPGRSDPLDLSDYLLGRPTYGSRTGSLEFYVDNDHEKWTNIRKKIANTLHGKRIKMVLEDDPGYYYEGRFTFNQWRSDEANSFVSIDYQLDPFKYSIYKNASANYDDDIWDTFNFDIDIYKSDKCWMRYNNGEYGMVDPHDANTDHEVVYKKERITGGLL